VSFRDDFRRRVREGLKKLEDRGPDLVAKHTPLAVAKGDAERLGHNLVWYDRPDHWIGVCLAWNCRDQVVVHKVKQFGRAQITGAAVTMRCPE
jgi:hypothetical protein